MNSHQSFSINRVHEAFHPKTEMSNGERQFARKCSVCHTLKADGKRRAGPTLYGVFGRRAGTLEVIHIRRL